MERVEPPQFEIPEMALLLANRMVDVDEIICCSRGRPGDMLVTPNFFRGFAAGGLLKNLTLFQSTGGSCPRSFGRAGLRVEKAGLFAARQKQRFALIAARLI